MPSLSNLVERNTELKQSGALYGMLTEKKVMSTNIMMKRIVINLGFSFLIQHKRIKNTRNNNPDISTLRLQDFSTDL